MQIYSALDALSPAFSRTKLVLFSPFRLGRTWKLGASAYLSVAGTVFVPFPLLLFGFVPLLRQASVPAGVVPIMTAAVIMATLVYLVVFYLCSRLRFAFFDIVLHRGAFVTPAWRKYGGASLRWALFNVLLGSLFLVLIAWPALSMGRRVFAGFSGIRFVPGQPPSREMMHAIFSIYAAFFLIYLGIAVFYLFSSLLADFVVPQLALEDVSLTDAFKRVGRFLRREPGAVALYAVLKVGIFLVGAMAVGIAFYVALLAVALVAMLVGGLIGLLLYFAHVPTSVLTALGIVCGSVIYLFTFFYGMMVANGTLFTVMEAYLLYFLGGRYPLLGEALEKSTPLPLINEPMYGAPPAAL